jgi:dephospho-CoA kinase
MPESEQQPPPIAPKPVHPVTPSPGHPVTLSPGHPVMVLGLLGGIGSGKSSVARELAKQGGWLINADELGHEALRQPDLKKQVIARFGPGIADPRGEIERKKLGSIVFADVHELRALEAIVFPFIGLRIREEVEAARQRADVRFITLDAAVMLEAGWHDACDRLIFVDAPAPLRLGRVKHKRGWSAADLQAREQLQMPLEEKRRRADAVVDNSGTPETLAAQVAALLRDWGLAPDASTQ